MKEKKKDAYAAMQKRMQKYMELMNKKFKPKSKGEMKNADV